MEATVAPNNAQSAPETIIVLNTGNVSITPAENALATAIALRVRYVPTTPADIAGIAILIANVLADRDAGRVLLEYRDEGYVCKKGSRIQILIVVINWENSRNKHHLQIFPDGHKYRDQRTIMQYFHKIL